MGGWIRKRSRWTAKPLELGGVLIFVCIQKDLRTFSHLASGIITLCLAANILQEAKHAATHG